MTTGLLNPGPEPTGSGRSAHQISPWETITTRFVQCAARGLSDERVVLVSNLVDHPIERFRNRSVRMAIHILANGIGIELAARFLLVFPRFRPV